MEVGTVYGSYYGTKGYEDVRKEEKRAEGKELTGTFTVSATGTDVKSVTQNLIATISGTSEPKGAGFDIKV